MLRRLTRCRTEKLALLTSRAMEERHDHLRNPAPSARVSAGVSAHVRPLPACCPSGSSQGEPYAVLPKLCCIYCCYAQYTQLS